tara:strand:- start:567 stop:869 length:303 start_codon:yes stop_codon:yes gene_type:complete
LIVRNVVSCLLISALVSIFAVLQYELWLGKQNVFDLYQLDKHIKEAVETNSELRERNDKLHEDIIDIKNRSEAIEAQARFDLGLIKPGETYYHIMRSNSK